jgi:ribonuclease HI
MRVILNTDGGARGNPGPAGIGVVIKNNNNETIYELGKTIGFSTNNEAEYTALIEGLLQCRAIKAKEVDARLDSELVVKQLNGIYKVKNERMNVFWNKVKDLEKYFTKVTFTHVPRTENKEADKLYNQALDLENN